MEPNELWQVEVAGNIYETDFAGLTQWIAESSLLPEDKIKCGNRPWIQAKLVPALAPYFTGKVPMVSENVATVSENHVPHEMPQQINTVVNEEAPVNFGGTEPHTSTGFASPFQTESAQPIQSFEPVQPIEKIRTEVVPPAAPIVQLSSPDSAAKKCCALHAVREARFACRQCLNLFCEECPRTIARVRICPMCGDMCNPFGTGETPSAKTSTGYRSGSAARSAMKPTSNIYVDPTFTFADFMAAWAYPFKFPIGLMLGGIVSSLLGIGVYLGMVTASIGGLFPGLMAMLVCGVLMIVIVYGSATKAVNQVAYGNMDETFMPNTEDFSIWNTILLPCFLGLGTCIVSWGPTVLVGIIIFKTFIGAMGELPREVKPAGTRSQPTVLTAPNQGFGAKDPLQREIEGNSRESEANAVKRIQDLQKTAPASSFGLTPAQQPDPKANEEAMAAVMKKIAPRVLPLILLLLLASLWGVFYFPSALTVAGYTESIGATLNPLVGFGMMRQMGSNYFKAFGTYLLLLIFSVFVYGGVMIITAPLAAAGLGETPAHFISNMISFYFYLVIACTFGRALYRSHEKMGFSVDG